jgi:hypothetical protein
MKEQIRLTTDNRQRTVFIFFFLHLTTYRLYLTFQIKTKSQLFRHKVTKTRLPAPEAQPMAGRHKGKNELNFLISKGNFGGWIVTEINSKRGDQDEGCHDRGRWGMYRVCKHPQSAE